jgi:hypothetical protein
VLLALVLAFVHMGHHLTEVGRNMPMVGLHMLVRQARYTNLGDAARLVRTDRTLNKGRKGVSAVLLALAATAVVYMGY